MVLRLGELLKATFNGKINPFVDHVLRISELVLLTATLRFAALRSESTLLQLIAFAFLFLCGAYVGALGGIIQSYFMNRTGIPSKLQWAGWILMSFLIGAVCLIAGVGFLTMLDDLVGSMGDD